MAGALHISISAETIFHIGSFPISNSILTSLIGSFLIIIFALIVRIKLKNTHEPKGIQNIAEMIIEGFFNLTQSVTGSEKKTRLFFPLVTTFFLFIITNNYLGIMPGVGAIGILEGEGLSSIHVENKPAISQIQASTAANNQTDEDNLNEHVAQDKQNQLHNTQNETNHENELEETTKGSSNHAGPKFVPLFRAGTADLNTTLALAIISVISTQIFGVMNLRLGYFKKFINFSSPIDFFVGILETISEFAKVISFAFRLFGNIFAGEVLLAVTTFLIPLIIPMPFYGLEIFVGFIQALVFSMLSLVFFNMATSGHNDH